MFSHVIAGRWQLGWRHQKVREALCPREILPSHSGTSAGKAGTAGGWPCVCLSPPSHTIMLSWASSQLDGFRVDMTRQQAFPRMSVPRLSGEVKTLF